MFKKTKELKSRIDVLDEMASKMNSILNNTGIILGVTGISTHIPSQIRGLRHDIGKLKDDFELLLNHLKLEIKEGEMLPKRIVKKTF